MQKQSKLNTILREPLIHFLLIGAALFFIYSQVNDSTTEDEKLINITKLELNTITSQWIKAKGREPSEEEKQEQIQKLIQEKILYREAIAKGLDKNDLTIRRHLAKKMRYVYDDNSLIPQATNEELKEYFSKNSSKFIESESLSFNQVVFTPTENSKDINKDANEFLKKLQSSKSKKISTIGDLVELSKKGIINTFGQEFASEAFTLDTKSWQGPIKTRHGLHLIYIHSKIDAKLPKFSEIEEKVNTEWQIEKREAANKVFYTQLYKDYEIVIEQKKTK